MIISESWLREWVPTRIDSEQLMHKLTMVGLEVGSVESAGEALDGVVVGHIDSIEQHPDADRLRICTVDVGQKAQLKIVCGAANAQQGLKVAVATVGTELPGGVKISRSTIRGAQSAGMLCSASELGLAENSAGILELTPQAPIGMRFDKHFKLDDNIIEIDLTPNRGDCMSVHGIARELACTTKTRLKVPKIEPVRASHKSRINIELKDPQACPRYVGRILKGVDPTASSPSWLVERLRRSGLRSISPVVDVTNYVMIELGQPMHAFDFDRLNGDIHVRWASKKEKLKLLDETDVTLSDRHLVIADDKKAIALAGIMGGASTAINDATTNIFLESAHFSPASIIGRARALGLHTDAAQRYERGVDPTIQKVAIERASALLLDIVGGEAGPTIDVIDRKAMPKKKPARLRAARLEKMIGRTYTDSQVTDVLTRLGMKVNETSTGWRVTPPAWRFDVEAEHDLVEEVARVVGFEQVVARAPVTVASETIRPETILHRDRIDNCLMTRDYREVVTYSFVDPEVQNLFFPNVAAIKLENPIASNMSDMRLSLLPGLVQTLVSNLNRQHRRVRLYEIGVVFGGSLKKRKETNRIGAIVTGDATDKHWSAESREVDFYDIKGDLESILNIGGLSANGRGIDDRGANGFRFEATESETSGLHPGQSANVMWGKEHVGVVGQLHPQIVQKLDIEQPVFVFEIDFDAVTTTLTPEFVEISKFPVTRRDISVLVDETTPVGHVRSIIEDSTDQLLVNLELFDIYRGDSIESNRKSLSFGLTLQDSSRTLVEAEVDAVVTKVVKDLETQIGATLRS